MKLLEIYSILVTLNLHRGIAKFLFIIDGNYSNIKKSTTHLFQYFFLIYWISEKMQCSKQFQFPLRGLLNSEIV